MFADTTGSDGKTIPGLITRMKNNALTEEDWDVLSKFNIVRKAASRVGGTPATPEAKAAAQSEAVADWLTSNLNFENSDAVTHSNYWTVDNAGRLVATDALYNTLGGKYQNYWFEDSSPYKGYALLNGILVPRNIDDDSEFARWWKTEGQEFKDLYAGGQWAEAAKKMQFKGSDKIWNYMDPYRQYSQYIPSNSVYRDVSGYYNFDGTGYVGAIELLEPDANSLLPKYTTYFIPKSGPKTTNANITRHARPVEGQAIPRFNIEIKNGRKYINYPVEVNGEKLEVLIELGQNNKPVASHILNPQNTEMVRTPIKYPDRPLEEVIYDVIHQHIPNVRSRASLPEYGDPSHKEGGVLYRQPGGPLHSQSFEYTPPTYTIENISDPTKPMKPEDIGYIAD